MLDPVCTVVVRPEDAPVVRRHPYDPGTRGRDVVQVLRSGLQRELAPGPPVVGRAQDIRHSADRPRVASIDSTYRQHVICGGFGGRLIDPGLPAVRGAKDGRPVCPRRACAGDPGIHGVDSASALKGQVLHSRWRPGSPGPPPVVGEKDCAGGPARHPCGVPAQRGYLQEVGVGYLGGRPLSLPGPPPVGGAGYRTVTTT